MKAKSRARYIIAALALAVLIMALVCLFVGASRMSFSDGVAALFGKGSAANVRILRSIRVPRVLAALIAGAAFRFPPLSVLFLRGGRTRPADGSEVLFRVARAVQRTVPAVTAAGGLSLFAAAHHRNDDREHDTAKCKAHEDRGPIIC